MGGSGVSVVAYSSMFWICPKTAEALDLTIRQSVQGRADEVIR